MIKKIFITLILVQFTNLLLAQKTQRLNTGWEFLKQDLGGIWEAVRPAAPGSPESVPIWQKVNLPHCFNANDVVDTVANYYQGPGWYRTLIDVNNPYNNGRTVLHFEGAGQKTEVFIYTNKVATHLGGYDEWQADITEAIATFKKTDTYQKRFKGKVPLSIRCDNSRDLETIPSQMSDFNVYGGLYRHLNLIYNPQVAINKLLITPTLSGNKASLSVRAGFDVNVDADIKYRIIVEDAAGKKVSETIYKSRIKPTDTALLLPQQVIQFLNPKLWTPAQPYLYTVKTNIEYHEQTYQSSQKIGFRNFEFEPHGPFYLNGQRLLLRGTHRHEDHAGVGAALTDSMMRHEMQMIKDMGANFIRLGHYQQSRLILNLCDSLGILVWEEAPWCRGGLGGVGYQQQAHQMLSNMIEQHYNHPSVILWGLGNENDWEGDFPNFDKDKIRTFMKQQNDLAHRLDATRLTTIRRCDFCRDIPDVYSPSIWAGWYKAKYTDYKAISEDEFKKSNRFFHAEWGGDSHAGRHAENTYAYQQILTPNSEDATKGKQPLSAKDGDWSETYICDLFDWHLKEQETMPWLTGSAFWTFKDFSTPLRPENPVPYVNQKGVVERDMTPKESYYVIQSYWANKPMVHIYGHTWPVRWGKANELKQVKVYSNCDEAELFMNGKSLGTKKRNSQDFPAAGLHWQAIYQEGNNAIKVIARKGKATITDHVTQAYQTAVWGKPTQLLLEQKYAKGDTVNITVKVLDGNNIPCLDAANWISFGIAGDGVLMDDLGTPGGSNKVQAGNGMATIKVLTRRGKSVISVRSPGLPTAFLNIGG